MAPKSRIETLEERIGRLETRVDDGFDNVGGYLGRLDERLSRHEKNHHSTRSVVKNSAGGGAIVAVIAVIVQVLMRVFGG